MDGPDDGLDLADVKSWVLTMRILLLCQSGDCNARGRLILPVGGYAGILE